MRYIKITTILFLFSNFATLAQVVYSFGSGGSEYGKASTVDNDSNYICAALFAQTINVNPAGVSNLSSRGFQPLKQGWN